MNHNFATGMRAVRLGFNFSVAEMADVLSVSIGTYQGWENGRSVCTVLKLMQICRVLKVTPNVLLHVDEKETTPAEQTFYTMRAVRELSLDTISNIRKWLTDPTCAVYDCDLTGRREFWVRKQRVCTVGKEFVFDFTPNVLRGPITAVPKHVAQSCEKATTKKVWENLNSDMLEVKI